MGNSLIIYEPTDWRNFGYLAALRPVYCLRSGMTALWQSLKREFPGYDLQFACRPELAHVTSRETMISPNQIDSSSLQRIVLIDASLRLDAGLAQELKQSDRSQCFTANGRVVSVVLVGEDIAKAGSILESLVGRQQNSPSAENDSCASLKSVAVSVNRYEYIWDLMLANPANIARDFEIALGELGEMRARNLADLLEGSQVVGGSAIFIHPTATVLPGVVFDTTSGPIYIDEETVIEPGSYIVGPFSAGANCRILGGKLAGSSLGPVCQVAGELEESVLQGFVNKHHAGFIGHSYIGEWVNFGAMTTNSDLKNNYSSVRVNINEKLRDSGSNKVGSFVGDHTKFGIGTLLNTGISIGVFCNIFGGTLIADKSVPSFSWGDGRSWQRHEVEKALETAQRAMSRRNRKLSEEDVLLIRSLSQSE
jgi:UDP-N-acetylglucosamine diphosphorylase/glucosamine-1-phosphate N-acetyltransferase